MEKNKRIQEILKNKAWMLFEQPNMRSIEYFANKDNSRVSITIYQHTEADILHKDLRTRIKFGSSGTMSLSEMDIVMRNLNIAREIAEIWNAEIPTLESN